MFLLTCCPFCIIHSIFFHLCFLILCVYFCFNYYCTVHLTFSLYLSSLFLFMLYSFLLCIVIFTFVNHRYQSFLCIYICWSFQVLLLLWPASPYPDFLLAHGGASVHVGGGDVGRGVVTCHFQQGAARTCNLYQRLIFQITKKAFLH